MAGRLAGCLMLDITHKMFNQILLIPTMVIGILPFYTDLYYTWGSRQSKAKPIAFIFLHTFHLIRMKFDVLMKQYKLNIIRLLLNKIFVNVGKRKCQKL